MPARKPKPDDDKAQFERFLEAVRQVEADETDEQLDRLMKQLHATKRTEK
jgi:hypothetical protein